MGEQTLLGFVIDIKIQAMTMENRWKIDEQR